MTDTAFLVAVLRAATPGAWVAHDVILRASTTRRGYGLTVHSRAADARRVLAASGETIECQVATMSNGWRRSYYRIAPLRVAA